MRLFSHQDRITCSPSSPMRPKRNYRLSHTLSLIPRAHKQEQMLFFPRLSRFRCLHREHHASPGIQHQGFSHYNDGSVPNDPHPPLCRQVSTTLSEPHFWHWAHAGKNGIGIKRPRTSRTMQEAPSISRAHPSHHHPDMRVRQRVSR